MRMRAWSFLVLGGALGACGADAVSTEPSAATSAPVATPATPPEDARIVTARADARAGREADAAVSLRALVNDAALDLDVRMAARLALVEIWLDHEERASDAGACMAEPSSAPPGAPHTVRDRGVAPALGARDAARRELRCVETSERDVSAARARIDAIVAREAAACAARGEVAMEGRVLGFVGTSADPCASDSVSTGMSALDQRLGVPEPVVSGEAFGILGGIE